MYAVRSLSTFWGNLSLPSSGSKSKPRVKQEETGRKKCHVVSCFVLLVPCDVLHFVPSKAYVIKKQYKLVCAECSVRAGP
jgi:hypothetical protein